MYRPVPGRGTTPPRVAYAANYHKNFTSLREPTWLDPCYQFRMSKRTGRGYDYNSKPRNWRQDRRRAVWVNALMLIVGLGLAACIVYLAITK